MPKSEFYRIIDEGSVEVSIPERSHFSLGTSPYYAHQHGLAIDIYHEISLKNYEVLSPVAGKIIETKEMIAPKPRFSEGIDKEYLTLIENRRDPKVVYKILHVNPTVKKGQAIEIGDILGTTIRNGYFAPWSSPHLHLEIRSNDDMVRARGGKDFSLLFDKMLDKEEFKEIKTDKTIPIVIKSIFSEFFLAFLPDIQYYKIPPFIGARGNISGSNCIIDGGIPIYKRGMALLNHEMNLDKDTSALINGNKIGSLWEIRGKMGFINFDRVKFYLNDVEIRGISLFLANFKPFIKIIPYNMKKHDYKINTSQKLIVNV